MFISGCILAETKPVLCEFVGQFKNEWLLVIKRTNLVWIINIVCSLYFFAQSRLEICDCGLNLFI